MTERDDAADSATAATPRPALRIVHEHPADESITESPVWQALWARLLAPPRTETPDEQIAA